MPGGCFKQVLLTGVPVPEVGVEQRSARASEKGEGGSSEENNTGHSY
jgi:hypothetical protein